MKQPTDPSAIATAIASARERLAGRASPSPTADSAARARLGAGLRVEVDGPHGWHVETDMARSVGGTASAPSPGWLFRAALASCDAVLIAMQCVEEGVELSALETQVTSESDGRGLLGDPSTPPGPLNVTLEVRIEARNRSRAELEAIVERALRRSPVSDAVRREIPVQVRLVNHSDA